MTIKFYKGVPNCGSIVGDMFLAETSLPFSTVSSGMNTLNTGITQCNYITLNFSLKIVYFNPFVWVYFQNIWGGGPAVRNMSLTGGGVFENCARAVRYIVGLVLTALSPLLPLCDCPLLSYY